MLERVRKTGLSDQQVHQLADLSSGWLTQARQGRYSATAPSVRKLARWLGRFEAGQKSERELRDATPADADAAGLSEDDRRERLGRILGKAIEDGAKTYAEVVIIERRIAAGAISGDLDEARAELALGALKGLKASLKLARAEGEQQALRALEVLTPVELKVLEDYRAKIVGPPVPPGAYVKPPELGGPKPATLPSAP